MPFRKIADSCKPCMSRDHNPPMHIFLGPGIWEYECPECGAKQSIHVPKNHMGNRSWVMSEVPEGNSREAGKYSGSDSHEPASVRLGYP